MLNVMVLLRKGGKDAWAVTANWLVKHYGFKELFTIEDISMYNPKIISTILVPYSFNTTANVKAKERFIINHTEARWIYFENEYNLPFSTWLKKASLETGKKWEMLVNFDPANIDHKSIINYDLVGKVHFANVNCLIHRDYPVDVTSPRKYDLIYWGMFRKTREEYFKKYFDENIIISTSVQNTIAFKNAVRPNGIPKFIEPIYLRGLKSELTQSRSGHLTSTRNF